MALTNLAKKICGGDDAVGENKGTGGTAADTKLVFFFALREPGGAALDEERGEFFLACIRAVWDRALREDGEEIGEAGIRDPHLLAVQRVGLAVGGEDGLRLGVHCVGPAGRFGQSVGRDDLA